jgi:hypothetical protein
MQNTRTIRNEEDLARLVYDIGNMRWPFRCTLAVGEASRTSQQNRTLHKWFGEIAAHRKDVTAIEVKAECNLQYGVPIKRRDNPEWDSAFGYIFDSLSYKAKVKAIRVFDIPVTRDMTVAQLSEYMSQLSREYIAQGVKLTIPEDR